MSTEAVNTIALDALTSGTLDNSEMLSAGELSSAPEPRAIRAPSTIHSAIGRTAGGSFASRSKKRSWDDAQLKRAAASSDEEHTELNAVADEAPGRTSQESGGFCTKALLAVAVLLLGGLGAATFLATLRQNRTLKDVQDTVNELESENAELAQALAALAEASALTSTSEPTPSPTELPAPTGVPTSVAPTPAPISPLPTTPIPTAVPTSIPTKVPSAAPTAFPTPAPTAAPTVVPSKAPTAFPTVAPSAAPTPAPTAAPTPTGGSCTFVNGVNLPYKFQVYDGSWTTYNQNGSSVTIPDGTTVKYKKTNWSYNCDLEKMQTTCQDGTLAPPDCVETPLVGSGMCKNSVWGEHTAWFRKATPGKTITQYGLECASDAIKIQARGYACTFTGPLAGACYIFPRFLWVNPRPLNGHVCGGSNAHAECPAQSTYTTANWSYVTATGTANGFSKIDGSTGMYVTTPASSSPTSFQCNAITLNYLLTTPAPLQGAFPRGRALSDTPGIPRLQPNTLVGGLGSLRALCRVPPSQSLRGVANGPVTTV